MCISSSPTAGGYTKSEAYVPRAQNSDFYLFSGTGGFRRNIRIRESVFPEAGKEENSDFANLKAHPQAIYQKQPTCFLDARWRIRRICRWN